MIIKRGVVCGGFTAADASSVIVRADSPLKTFTFFLLATHIIGAERAESSPYQSVIYRPRELSTHMAE
jgi:hypothetical protein